MSFDSYKYLPVSTCINGAFVLGDLDLLRHFILRADNGRFAFNTTDLTWGKGLKIILDHFNDRIFLPPITSVKLSPDSISDLKESITQSSRKYEDHDFYSYTGYFDAISKKQGPQGCFNGNNFNSCCLGWLRGIKDTSDSNISRDILALRRQYYLEDFRFYSLMVSLDLPASGLVPTQDDQLPKPSSSDHLNWIRACLLHARYDQIITFDPDLIASALENNSIEVNCPDHLTLEVVEMYQRTSNFIREHIPRSSNRELYLTALELYLNREAHDPALLYAHIDTHVLYGITRCANFKQLQQLQRFLISRDLYWDFNGFINDVLYDPVQTLLLVRPNADNMLHKYNFTLWRQGRLLAVTEELKHIAETQPDTHDYIYNTLLQYGWGQTV